MDRRFDPTTWLAYCALAFLCGSVTAGTHLPGPAQLPPAYPMGITWLDYAPNADVWRNSTAPDFAGIQMGRTRFDILVGSPYTHALHADHTIGVTPILATLSSGADSGGHQDYAAGSPNVSNPQGYGVRLGWMGQLSPQLTAGMTLQSQIYATASEQGRRLADRTVNSAVPPAVSAGLAYAFSSRLTVAFDWQRVYYSSLDPLARDEVGGRLSTDGTVGATDADDLEVFQLGVQWLYTPRLMLSAGVNHQASIGDERSESTASAIAQTHANLGLSYRPNPDQMLTLSYTHSLQGGYGERHPYLLVPQTGPNLRQNEIELTWGLSFD